MWPQITVRPTMERIREALFNQVTSMHLFEDRSVRVLDLCAGGSEALLGALRSFADRHRLTWG